MTSKQLSFGLGNTASGNLNKKQHQSKYKQIDLDGLDVQMLSPQFLQSKTLKKPLKFYGIQLQKSGQNLVKPQNDKTQKNGIGKNFNFASLKQIEESEANMNKTQKLDYTFITMNQNKKIKPAYKNMDQDQTLKNKQLNQKFQFSLDDKNTIFTAILNKGTKPKKRITFADTISSNENKQEVVQKKAGKAQNKLKQLFNKNVTKPSSFAENIKKQIKNEDIEEDIQQSINEYGEEDFEKYSLEGSNIKESIRQQLGGSNSGFIKESIVQISGSKFNKSEIAQQIQESIRASKSAGKEGIAEEIQSYKSSAGNIKQQIMESLSGSRKSGQSIYEQIFQDYEQSLKNSRNAFKKSTNFKQKDDILSKSFRKKTTVVKSIKLAQQINQHNKVDLQEESHRKNQTNKFHHQLAKQQSDIAKKKADLRQLFNNKYNNFSTSQKNKNLLYQFKIQINKLLTSQNFQSKLKKLTSFINFGQSNQLSSINLLQDKIMKNILQSIEKIKFPQNQSGSFQKIKQQYDNKLVTMLKDQEINLRVQMDNKLHLKDMELKKMIAQLQQKFKGKFVSTEPKFNNFISNQQNYLNNGSQLFQLQSDYSIDSDNVSWKADLWQVLPQFQKKKLYDKQTKEVTNFLTDIMFNQLKQQSFHRDLDISFQFPQQYNNLSSSGSNLPSLTKNKASNYTQDISMPKAAFNRKQFDQNISLTHSITPKKQSVFPDFPRPKQKAPDNVLDLNKKQNINQYYKVQGQQIVEMTKKLGMQKQRVLKTLSKYKSIYNRKKNDVIRKILKTLRPKDSTKVPQQNLLSIIQDINLLNKEDIEQSDLIYVRAYEEQLVWCLVNIIIKNQNKKTQLIEEQMRKNYERLVVLCQVKTAQSNEQVVCLNIYEQNKEMEKMKRNIDMMVTKQCPLQVGVKNEAIELVQKKQERKVKDKLVQNILNILMNQFAQQMPKRKK